MTALNVFGNRGGWPLSMFLTAEGKPIVGGTYWPPEDQEVDGEKVSGFKTILKTIHDAGKEKPEGARRTGRQAGRGHRATPWPAPPAASPWSS